MSYATPPELWPVNQDAWAVWQQVKTQWRATGFGVFGLDYNEVRRAFKDLDIPYNTRNRKKIQAMEKEILDRDNSADT